VLLYCRPMGSFAGRGGADGGSHRRAISGGDVLLVNHSLHRARLPRAGQVVMYEIPQTQVYDTTDATITRSVILAAKRLTGCLPSRATRSSGRRRKANCQRRRISLAAAQPTRIKTPFCCKSREFRVHPSQHDLVHAQPEPSARRELVLISKWNVSGTVYLRTHPLGRMQFIR